MKSLSVRLRILFQFFVLVIGLAMITPLAYSHPDEHLHSLSELPVEQELTPEEFKATKKLIHCLQRSKNYRQLFYSIHALKKSGSLSLSLQKCRQSPLSTGIDGDNGVDGMRALVPDVNEFLKLKEIVDGFWTFRRAHRGSNESSLITECRGRNFGLVAVITVGIRVDVQGFRCSKSFYSSFLMLGAGPGGAYGIGIGAPFTNPGDTMEEWLAFRSSIQKNNFPIYVSFQPGDGDDRGNLIPFYETRSILAGFQIPLGITRMDAQRFVRDFGVTDFKEIAEVRVATPIRNTIRR
jgi:hypothetical protein